MPRWAVALLMLAVLAPLAPAHAHNLPYALVTVDLRTPGEARVAVRCHVPALVMAAPQGHLSDTLVTAFAGMDDRLLAERSRATATAFSRRLSVRVDGQLVAPPEVALPPPSVLKADAAVSRASPKPSAPLRFSVATGAARTLDIALPPDLGPSVISVIHADGGTTTVPVAGGERSPPIRIAGPDPVGDTLATLASFIGEGFRHILPGGLDHMLFIVALALGAPRFVALLKLATVFTIAHSITLALATTGLVAAPGRVVEPLIALSIVAAAILNLRPSAESETPWRYGVIFAVGLLHGLGFAGALAELGVLRGQLTAALVGFNLGVEAGQVAVIAVVLAAVGWARNRAWYGPRIMTPASIAVACVAAYWTVERLIA